MSIQETGKKIQRFGIEMIKAGVGIMFGIILLIIILGIVGIL